MMDKIGKLRRVVTVEKISPFLKVMILDSNVSICFSKTLLEICPLFLTSHHQEVMVLNSNVSICFSKTLLEICLLSLTSHCQEVMVLNSNVSICFSKTFSEIHVISLFNIPSSRETKGICIELKDHKTHIFSFLLWIKVCFQFR